MVPIVSGLTGLISGLIAASWRAGLGLATRYDVDLRDKRLQAYKELWPALKGLDRRARPATMTVREARALLEQLTGWYHNTGGVLMSRATQRKFATLQRMLVQAREGAPEDAQLDANTLDQLLSSASALRTGTTDDVLSRRGPLLAPRRLRP